jgi:hypothetical protein
VLKFVQNWAWLSSLASGVLLVLCGYRIIPAGDELWYRNSGRFVRVCGFLLVLVSILLAVVRYAAPRHHG